VRKAPGQNQQHAPRAERAAFLTRRRLTLVNSVTGQRKLWITSVTGNWQGVTTSAVETKIFETDKQYVKGKHLMITTEIMEINGILEGDHNN
jgi:hypothetical protein